MATLPASANGISASRSAAAACRIASSMVSKSLDTCRAVPVTRSHESSTMVRIAATADLHAGVDDWEHVIEAFAKLEACADLVLLAGDLTQHGEVDEARVVAEACRELSIPVVSVLGNHDWQS